MMPNLNLANQMLRSARPAAVPRLLQSSSKASRPIVKATTVPDAGMFGASADLPGEPGGQIEPDLLDQNPSGPISGATPPPRFDPGTGLGQVDIDPSDPGGAGEWGDHAGRLGSGFNPINASETWLGGSFLGFDRNTGKPVYDPLGYGPGDPGSDVAGGPGGTGGGYGPTASNSGNPNYPGKWGFGSKYWVF